MFVLRRKFFGLLLLIKITVSNFIGKSFNLLPYSKGAATPVVAAIHSSVKEAPKPCNRLDLCSTSEN